MLRWEREKEQKQQTKRRRQTKPFPFAIGLLANTKRSEGETARRCGHSRCCGPLPAKLPIPFVFFFLAAHPKSLLPLPSVVFSLFSCLACRTVPVIAGGPNGDVRGPCLCVFFCVPSSPWLWFFLWARTAHPLVRHPFCFVPFRGGFSSGWLLLFFLCSCSCLQFGCCWWGVIFMLQYYSCALLRIRVRLVPRLRVALNDGG